MNVSQVIEIAKEWVEENVSQLPGFCGAYLGGSLSRMQKNEWRMYLMETIEEKFRQLPPNLQEEAVNFIDFLLTKTHSTTRKKISFDWIGGLKEYRDKYTAIELQKKALEWRD